MENKVRTKKIAFCITCMNRLYHLQQTLEKNIIDNYLVDDVEFVLLDYNSNDGLEEWVQQNMQSYINSGILVYYKTLDPQYYHRSHSRNMAFRLANAKIVCNLDADNFLGEGFAVFMINQFEKEKNIFYISDLLCCDIYGRVCVKNSDFKLIRGYNEALQSYGCEDEDLFNRLQNLGLTQKHFDNPDYYNCIKHSDEERIKDEFMSKNLQKAYISYINPYTSNILFQYKNFTFAQYTLIDNLHFNLYTDFSGNKIGFFDERKHITVEKDFQKGIWHQNNDEITLIQNDYTIVFNQETSEFIYQNRTYYAITDNNLLTEIMLSLSLAINSHRIQHISKEKSINEQGFGKGTVFKNFNIHKAINLS
jgi:hypothetical protein